MSERQDRKGTQIDGDGVTPVTRNAKDRNDLPLRAVAGDANG